VLILIDTLDNLLLTIVRDTKCSSGRLDKTGGVLTAGEMSHPDKNVNRQW
jgi:hypothetical protein